MLLGKKKERNVMHEMKKMNNIGVYILFFIYLLLKWLDGYIFVWINL